MKGFGLFIILVCFCSCARKVFIQEAYSLENNTAPTSNRVDIKTFYGGDAFSYITFQIEVDNRSEDSIILSEQKVTLEFVDQGDDIVLFQPIKKNDLLNEYLSEERGIDTEKKVSTVGNVVLSGLGVLVGVLSGADPAATIIYGTESAVGILEEREYYNNAQGSLEEQIAYIDEYTLSVDTIPPGRKGSYDIHFERLMVTGQATLKIICEAMDYSSAYELEVIETKAR